MTAKNTIKLDAENTLEYWTLERMAAATPFEIPSCDAFEQSPEGIGPQPGMPDDFGFPDEEEDPTVPGGPDDDLEVAGDPKPVPARLKRLAPYKYIGKVFVHFVDGNMEYDNWGTATLVKGSDGSAKLLTCAHIFRHSSSTAILKEAAFAPAYDATLPDRHDWTPFGTWSVADVKISSALGDSGTQYSIFFDYALASLGSTRKQYVNGASKVSTKPISKVFNLAEAPTIDHDYLPKDIRNQEVYWLVAIGYSEIFENGDRLYEERCQYFGSELARRPESGDDELQEEEVYMGAEIPKGKVAEQRFNLVLAQGMSGAPIFKPRSNEVVGLVIGGTPNFTPSVGFSPTFNSREFTDFWKKFW